jgi:hypothetical protein
MLDIVLCSEEEGSPIRFQNLKLAAGVESNIQYLKVNIGNGRGGLITNEKGGGRKLLYQSKNERR